VDDSKGTNVAATATALESLPGTKVVILGGQGKGEDYSDLARAVRQHARAVILIGSEAPRIRDSLVRSNFTNFYEEEDMEQAVLRASLIAGEGETVLLSPACTSWDMYPNYKERGRHFQELVRHLGDR
jgi:UDP-N-acetylmuramoylalanine--D-glutamate ligase